MRAAGRRDADQRAQEFRIAGNERRRQTAVANQLRRAIGIGEYGLEQFGALDEAGFELRAIHSAR